MERRSFLFLQGNASRFYRMLGAALAARGHAIRRINFCGGDRSFWGDWQATDWPGGLAGLPDFLDHEYRRHQISDILLFGDCRPIHRAALAAARRRGIAIRVFEEGYLRPGWITLERDGVNGNSRLPDDPSWYREVAAVAAPNPAPPPAASGLPRRILYDFQWQAMNYVRLRRYPGYETHRPYPIWAEYATWAARLAKLSWRRRAARRTAADLARGNRPYFLFPLQLDSDSQIRVHSRFGRLRDAIEEVVDDFATHAPSPSLLVVKNHPLDNGWIDHGRVVARRAASRGIADRVVFIDGGALGPLIRGARGIVTVNSTVGLAAVEQGRPVICLGEAIYDMPGLTFDGPLAEFWRASGPPDPALFAAFRIVLQQASLVAGDYYTRPGVEQAVASGIARLEDPADFLADAPRPRRSRRIQHRTAGSPGALVDAA